MGDVDKLKNGGFTSRKVSNKCTKYYCNRTTHVQFVIRHVVTCFFLSHGLGDGQNRHSQLGSQICELEP